MQYRTLLTDRANFTPFRLEITFESENETYNFIRMLEGYKLSDDFKVKMTELGYVITQRLNKVT